MTRVFGAGGWILIMRRKPCVSTVTCSASHQPSKRFLKTSVETQGLRLDRPLKPEHFKINEKDLTMKRKGNINRVGAEKKKALGCCSYSRRAFESQREWLAGREGDECRDAIYRVSKYRQSTNPCSHVL